jgi:hypothetical protein
MSAESPRIDYAELHCLSNFSFLRGASHPEELVLTAAKLGYRAIAITDECSLAGVVRAHEAALECEMHLIIGAQFHIHDGGRRGGGWERAAIVCIAPIWPMACAAVWPSCQAVSVQARAQIRALGKQDRTVEMASPGHRCRVPNTWILLPAVLRVSPGWP